MTPKISIIIPTHSRPHLLERAVASALDAATDVEVIIVDDASTDDTAKVCRRLQKLKGVHSIRLERNQGVAGARNIGLLASSADYVAFLDDDDLRLPGSLDLQMAALTNRPEAGFACGRMMIGDQDCTPTGEIIQPQVADGDAFWQCLSLNFPVLLISVVVRKRCFFRVGLFNSGVTGIDDWDMLARLTELFSVVVVDQPVCIYRAPTPASNQGSSSQSRQLARAIHHQRQLLRLPRAAKASPARRRAVRREALCRATDTLLWNAAKRVQEKHYTTACANVITSLRLNPLRVARSVTPHRLVRCLQHSRS